MSKSSCVEVTYWCELIHLSKNKYKKKTFHYYVHHFAGSLSTTFGKIQNLDRDVRVPQCRLSPSLRSQRDASSVSDLSLLQVLDQLSQPAFGGGVVLQHLGEGAVLKLVWQTLTQGFSGSEII